MNIRDAILSKTGPRSINEDCADLWKRSTDEIIACVADGLGGMGSGDIASRLAIDVFREALPSSPLSEASLLHAATVAHERIHEQQHVDKALSRMATTFTALALSNDMLFGVHCGDSRAALARGAGIKKLTRDHSEGQRLYEAGKLTKEELLTYPRKHILESALGAPQEPIIDTFQTNIKPGDRLFLTTDGIHNIIPLRQMLEISMESESPDDFCNNIDFNINLRGASDNYTILTLYLYPVE